MVKEFESLTHRHILKAPAEMLGLFRFSATRN